MNETLFIDKDRNELWREPSPFPIAAGDFIQKEIRGPLFVAQNLYWLKSDLGWFLVVTVRPLDSRDGKGPFPLFIDGASFISWKEPEK